ncbi:hypothetical protein GGI12_003743 [Dipsacomyces acuminosporus]|nr:hypothetical protein GGI12_003743 [Dipsacomyces acuminosporus]
MPSHSDDDVMTTAPATTAEKPIFVKLETEPPVRKPGRPRLGISSHFQDTGEMANHSHRFVWCIACIKSGRPLYKKDRLPARGDLMQRHLLSCKYVEQDVKERFCNSSKSNTASSSNPASAAAAAAAAAAVSEARQRKSRVSNIISEPMPMSVSPVHTSPLHSQRHPILPPIVTSVGQEPSPKMITSARTTHIPPHHPRHITPPHFAHSRPSPSAGLGTSSSFHSPPLRATTSLDLPSLSHRAHPYRSSSGSSRGSHTPTSSMVRSPMPAQAPIQLPPLTLPHNIRLSPSSTASSNAGLSGGGTSFRISRNSPPTAHTTRSSPAAPAAPMASAPAAISAPASLSSISTLRGKLAKGANAYGIVLSVPSPVTARVAANLGFDWACVDMEHSPQAASTMAEMVAAITSTGSCAPIVRVPSHSEEWIRWAVEAGAQGVIIPAVQNREQMWRLVSMCRHAAQNASSASGSGPSSFGFGVQPRRVPSYQQVQPPPLPFGQSRLQRGSPDLASATSPSANDLLIIAQIESTEAVDNIDEILSVQGVDAVFVRPQNLSSGHSPVLPPQITSAGTACGSLGRVVGAARHFSVALGIDCADGDAARMRVQQGFQMVVVANDLEVLTSAAAQQLSRARTN